MNRFPNDGNTDSPSGELAWVLALSRLYSKSTYDVLAEVTVGEGHDCLERVWTGSVWHDGDVVCGGHAVGQCLVLVIVGERKWESAGAETHLATLINSVIPPSHMTSGCRISTARFSINFLNPYFEYSCSPVVNLM